MPAPALPSSGSDRDADHTRPVALLLNVAHALDHLFLLIFATAVAAIAHEFSYARWEDLMPYSVGAFIMFGLGSIPAGQLGDRWGRRPMMLVFFFGLGASSVLTAFTQTAWQLAIGLTLIGSFAAIYHPVGIPMLVQNSARPGATIGVNGLAGNLGVAGAALLTGFLVQTWHWRAAFIVPGLVALACGIAFAVCCPSQGAAPVRNPKPPRQILPPKELARALLVMTAAAVTGSLLFNFTTNGNPQFMTERFAGVVDNPATIGLLLALVYALASVAQVLVGWLIDRLPFKHLYFALVLAQVPWLILAAWASGWWLFVALLGTMLCIFGCVPFSDAMVVQYVDDSMRSRVAGLRLAISLGISSLAVWLLGPAVKASSFTALFVGMALVSVCTALLVLLLPASKRST